MLAVSPALAALLNSRGQFAVADLYTWTLIDGTVFRWTDWDLPVSIGSQTWQLGPPLSRTNCTLQLGVEVDKLTVTLMPARTDLIGSVPAAAFIAAGGLDGARLSLARAYAAGPGSPWVGAITLFNGRVASPQGGRAQLTIDINSDLSLLNIQMPRNLYQPGCNRTLYDAGCGVSRAAYTVNSSVTGGDGMTLQTNLSAADHFYDLGVLRFTAGANAGLSRTVRAQTGGQVVLVYPLPKTPTVGDAFALYPACDKTRGAGGCARFSNLPKFRGFPYVPVVETSL